MPLPKVHLLTCEARKNSCKDTLVRLSRTDWPVLPTVHCDPVREEEAPRWGRPERVHRLTEAFAFMLRAALVEPGDDPDWLLFLEDDLDFHPHLARHVSQWVALWDANCCCASLFNSGVRERAVPGAPVHAFAAEADSYIGSQALLLRRGAAQKALRQWDSLVGLQCQRLAGMFGHGNPLWVHQPSLVQHVAADSSWGAYIKRATDFDPAWEPRKPGRNT